MQFARLDDDFRKEGNGIIAPVANGIVVCVGNALRFSLKNKRQDIAISGIAKTFYLRNVVDPVDASFIDTFTSLDLRSAASLII